MTNLTDTYQNLESDAIRWLDTARGFMMSARLIWSKLTPLFDDGFPLQNRHAEMFAYSQSFLLLTGFAFENLYRGMLTATGSSWRKALDTKGGHALFKHLSGVATPNLSEEEKYLVKRLETYLSWAGRYPVPKKSGDYVNAVEKFLCGFNSSDLDVATRLFARLEEKLLAEAAKTADRAEDAFLQSLSSQKNQLADATGKYTAIAVSMIGAAMSP
jgi:hypothetical protein